MTLISIYHQGVIQGKIHDDEQQHQALDALELRHEQLQIKPRFWQRKPKIKGLYIHGPVGSGKTFLMDLFFNHTPSCNKVRYHFHEFMQEVDHQLRTLQGHKNPLQYIATNIAKETQVLCFDEFLVHDVAYAMILGELLQALLKQGVILIATSNIEPDNLYAGGVQRKRFLPAIDLIKSHCDVIHVEGKRDYRLNKIHQKDSWITPLNATKKIQALFTSHSPNFTADGTITIQKRQVPFIQCGDQTIWFDFKVICSMPRSQLDYLELASKFKTIFISNIPKLTKSDTVNALLLIHFVDVMYDKHIQIIFNAQVSASELYTQGEMLSEFKRTLSRLEEMQSADYRNC